MFVAAGEHGALSYIELLQRMAGFAADDDPAIRLEKLDALLRKQGAVEPETLALLAALMSVPAGDLPPRLEMSPLVQRQRTLAALVLLLARATRHLPVLLLYEDLHWLDPTSGDLLDQSCRDPGRAVARPSNHAAWC